MSQKRHPVSSLGAGKPVLRPELGLGKTPLPRVRDESVGGPTEFGILAGHLRGSTGDQGEGQERRLEKNPQKHIY